MGGAILYSHVYLAVDLGCFPCSGGIERRHIGESSDTESADVRPKDAKKPIKFTSLFKKNKDQVASEPELEPKTLESQDDEEPKKSPFPEGDERALVYAELDLVRADMGHPVVKGDDDKTEYAEIIYSQNEDKELPKK